MTAATDPALGVCRDCGQAIRWTTTVNARRLPVDPTSNPAGNVAAYRDHAGTWRSRVLHKGERPSRHEKPFMPHAATCPARRPAQLPLDIDVARPGVVSLATWKARRRPRP